MLTAKPIYKVMFSKPELSPFSNRVRICVNVVMTRASDSMKP